MSVAILEIAAAIDTLIEASLERREARRSRPDLRRVTYHHDGRSGRVVEGETVDALAFARRRHGPRKAG